MASSKCQANRHGYKTLKKRWLLFPTPSSTVIPPGKVESTYSLLDAKITTSVSDFYERGRDEISYFKGFIYERKKVKKKRLAAFD